MFHHGNIDTLKETTKASVFGKSPISLDYQKSNNSETFEGHQQKIQLNPVFNNGLDCAVIYFQGYLQYLFVMKNESNFMVFFLFCKSFKCFRLNEKCRQRKLPAFMWVFKIHNNTTRINQIFINQAFINL
jgi:hypothetical protein